MKNNYAKLRTLRKLKVVGFPSSTPQLSGPSEEASTAPEPPPQRSVLREYWKPALCLVTMGASPWIYWGCRKLFAD